MKKPALILLIILALLACNRSIVGGEERVIRGTIQLDAIDEASGLAASRRSPDVLWTHNDSGDAARIFAIDTSGHALGVFYLRGTTARDWEDIASGPGPQPGLSYLYIADIGDNKARYEQVFIHRIIEPVPGSRSAPKVDTVAVATLTLTYPDGPRDAEALLVDPITRSFVIVSKREKHVRVYTTALGFEPGEKRQLALLDSLPVTQITAGDISPSGNHVVIKNYTTIFSWQRTGHTLAGLFARQPDTLFYLPEPQGEALCIEMNGRGYYTLSEERSRIPARLYFYPKMFIK